MSRMSSLSEAVRTAVNTLGREAPRESVSRWVSEHYPQGRSQLGKKTFENALYNARKNYRPLANGNHSSLNGDRVAATATQPSAAHHTNPSTAFSQNEQSNGPVGAQNSFNFGSAVDLFRELHGLCRKFGRENVRTVLDGMPE